MAIIDFGGVKEEVVMRSEFPMKKAREVLKNETVAVIGYGVHGPGQSPNMKDNGFSVIVGQSKDFMRDWDRAVSDGWKPGIDLFEIDEAAKRGTIIGMIFADAAHKQQWPNIKKHLMSGKALYFSHGFSIVYKDQTKIIPPKDADVIMVAPKGSGTSLRRNFLSGAGINSSFAATGHDDTVSPVAPAITVQAALEADKRNMTRAKRYLSDKVTTIRSRHIESSYQVLIGDPADSIMEFSEKENIDLVVMTTHGRSGLKRAVMGSIADAVIRGSGKPVLVVRPQSSSKR